MRERERERKYSHAPSTLERIKANIEKIQKKKNIPLSVEEVDVNADQVLRNIRSKIRNFFETSIIFPFLLPLRLPVAKRKEQGNNDDS